MRRSTMNLKIVEIHFKQNLGATEQMKHFASMSFKFFLMIKAGNISVNYVFTNTSGASI